MAAGWLSRVAIAGALALGVAGCQAERGHVPGGDFNGAVSSEDPATLVSLLASTTTPEASRKSADKLLVQAKGKTDPTREAVLEQILYAPGHSDEMRMYAMDQLVDADPARADQAFMLYLPKFDEGRVLTHACGLCARIGDERLCEPLIRSLARDVAPGGAGSPEKRAEWGAIEKLGGRPVVETLYGIMEASNTPPVRIAALDIVEKVESVGAIVQRVGRMQRQDPYIVDLQWWLKTFGVPPTGESETAWMERLHRPEDAALVARAVGRDRRLRGERDYVFAPRFVTVLAYADETGIGMTREALLADIQRRLAAFPHVRRTPDYPHSPEDIDESLKANERKLSRGDLLAIRLLLQTLTSPAAIDTLHRQGLEDLSDTTTEHGGLLALENVQTPALTATVYPPFFGTNDFQYVTGDALLAQTVEGVAQYHFHFQEIHNAARAGPGAGDLAYVRNARCNCVAITSVDTRKMDIDYYTPGGAVVDLGVRETK